MHTSTASREVTGNRAVFAGAVVAVVCGADVTVIITVAGRGGGEGVADGKTSVGTSFEEDECLSGLRVYDVPPLIDTFEVCGS